MRIADEMGLNKKMQIAVPNLSMTMVEAAGPDIMSGVLGTEPWTWRVPEVEGSERGGRSSRTLASAIRRTHPAPLQPPIPSFINGPMPLAAPGALTAKR